MRSGPDGGEADSEASSTKAAGLTRWQLLCTCVGGWEPGDVGSVSRRRRGVRGALQDQATVEQAGAGGKQPSSPEWRANGVVWKVGGDTLQWALDACLKARMFLMPKREPLVV